MPSLWDELQPLALRVEESREKIIEAGRVYAHEQSAASGQAIIGAVRDLEEAQMALGLKTSQILLARMPIGPASVAGLEAFDAPGEAQEKAPRPRPEGAGLGVHWGRKRGDL